MTTMTSELSIQERREQALAALPPYRRPGRAVRRWLRAHLIQFLAALALLYTFAPIFVVVLFSFNNPDGRYNYVWTDFSTKAWVNIWQDTDITKDLTDL